MDVLNRAQSKWSIRLDTLLCLKAEAQSASKTYHFIKY